MVYTDATNPKLCWKGIEPVTKHDLKKNQSEITKYIKTHLRVKEVPPVCMFDNFHLTFNFISKVSHDVLKN